MDFYKHFIRLDADKNIIYSFSDAFEQPQAGDICINEQGGRQFELLGQVNPALRNMQGVYLYRYANKKVVAKTPAEIQAEVDAFPPPVVVPPIDTGPTVHDILNLLSGVK